jgi:hypothetical protein
MGKWIHPNLVGEETGRNMIQILSVGIDKERGSYSMKTL